LARNGRALGSLPGLPQHALELLYRPPQPFAAPHLVGIVAEELAQVMHGHGWQNTPALGAAPPRKLDGEIQCK
jgi:hypothetical protein